MRNPDGISLMAIILAAVALPDKLKVANFLPVRYSGAGQAQRIELIGHESLTMNPK
jgi:hypothetical protein